MCYYAKIPDIIHAAKIKISIGLLLKSHYLSGSSITIMANTQKLEEIASQVRRDIVRMVTDAASGHPGGSMSSTDILTTLFFNKMDCDPINWTKTGKGKDMFFLSAGHMSPLYYSILARKGYFPISELSTFRKIGSRLQGHPSIEAGLPGIHQAAGSLGQGLSVAAGAALSKKLNKDNHNVYVLIGDGESEEGQIWEAAMFAAQKKINNLIAMTDWNGQQIDGPTSEISSLGDLPGKWEKFGWDVTVADGHNIQSILDSFENATTKSNNDKPKMILFKTQMGQGVDFMVGTNKWHGKAPSKEQCADALSQLKETLGDY